jgi:hypothetical protein
LIKKIDESDDGLGRRLIAARYSLKNNQKIPASNLIEEKSGFRKTRRKLRNHEQQGTWNRVPTYDYILAK